MYYITHLLCIQQNQDRRSLCAPQSLGNQKQERRKWLDSKKQITFPSEAKRHSSPVLLERCKVDFTS
jgi:hypothetical protein